MATFVIPFHVNGKTRLGDRELAQAMLADVQDAARDALVVDRPGGQGDALAAALAEIEGPVTIVNSDLPCVTAAELEQLTAAAPAIVGEGGRAREMAGPRSGDRGGRRRDDECPRAPRRPRLRAALRQRERVAI